MTENNERGYQKGREWTDDEIELALAARAVLDNPDDEEKKEAFRKLLEVKSQERKASKKEKGISSDLE